MRLFIILFLTTLPPWGQDSNPIKLGLGIVAIEDAYDGSKSVTIYSDKHLTTKTVDFKLSGQLNNVSPFYFKPDYGLCYFVCLEKTNDYYKILINENEEGFLKNDGDRYFVSWESLLVNKIVERVDIKTNPLRLKPGDNETIINLDFEIKADRLEIVEVIEIKGESWVKVNYSKSGKVGCDKLTTDDIGEGWIKWRRGDKLLVNILLLC
jgi:hypothetical protein